MINKLSVLLVIILCENDATYNALESSKLKIIVMQNKCNSTTQGYLKFLDFYASCHSVPKLIKLEIEICISLEA